MKRPANSDMMIYAREAFREAWPGVRHEACAGLHPYCGGEAFAQSVEVVLGRQIPPRMVATVAWWPDHERHCVVQLVCHSQGEVAEGRARSYTEATRLAVERRKALVERTKLAEATMHQAAPAER